MDDETRRIGDELLRQLGQPVPEGPSDRNTDEQEVGAWLARELGVEDHAPTTPSIQPPGDSSIFESDIEPPDRQGLPPRGVDTWYPLERPDHGSL